MFWGLRFESDWVFFRESIKNLSKGAKSCDSRSKGAKSCDSRSKGEKSCDSRSNQVSVIIVFRKFKKFL